MIELLREMADAVSDAIADSERSTWVEYMGIGADGTATNRIDVIAENAVRKVLEEQGNPMNLLSEEAGFIDFGRERTLVLDPVDGTYNAMNGIPFYAVSLAVSGSSMADTEYALVRNLVSGDEYTATRGKGAFLNGEPIHVREISDGRPVSSIYLGSAASELSFSIAKASGRARSMGSAALEICQVAAGSTDLYCYCPRSESGGLRVVDIAAASLILREAGGSVLDRNFIMLDMRLDVRERASVLAIGDESVMKVIR